MNVSVVYKKENSWFTGAIKEYKLRKKKQINKLSDVKDTAVYITLKKWLSENENESEYTFDELISKLKVQSLYVKTEDTPKNNKTHSRKGMTEEKFWSKFNTICLSCIKDCKQSSYAEIIVCNRRSNIKK